MKKYPFINTHKNKIDSIKYVLTRSARSLAENIARLARSLTSPPHTHFFTTLGFAGVCVQSFPAF